MTSLGRIPFGRLYSGRRSWTSVSEKERWVVERKKREISAAAYCAFGGGAIDEREERDDDEIYEERERERRLGLRNWGR